METIGTLFTLWLIFQVGLFTWIRLIDSVAPEAGFGFNRRIWLLSMMPGIGILIVTFLIFRKAWIS